MPDRVLLKDFDPSYKTAVAMIAKIVRRADLEGAKPTVWTKAQKEDLSIIVDTLTYLSRAEGDGSTRARRLKDDLEARPALATISAIARGEGRPVQWPIAHEYAVNIPASSPRPTL